MFAKFLKTLAAVACASYLVSCSLQGPDLKPTNAGLDIPDGMGAISLRVPSISSTISELVEKTAATSPRVKGMQAGIRQSSRAYLLASSIVIRLLDSDGNIVDSMELLPDSEASAFVGNILTVPGTGYTAEADIYNSYVSESVPVCKGSSDPFDILNGEIADVDVVCLPNNPSPLELGGAEIELSLVPSSFNILDRGTTMREEAWFSFTAQESTTTIMLEAEDEARPGFGVIIHNQDGESVGEFFPGMNFIMGGGSPQKRYYENITTVIGNTYYLGALSTNIEFPFSPIYAGDFRLSLPLNVADDINLETASGPVTVTQTGINSYMAVISDTENAATLEILPIEALATVRVNGTLEADYEADLSLIQACTEIRVAVETPSGLEGTVLLQVFRAPNMVDSVEYELDVIGPKPHYLLMAVDPSSDYEISWDDLYEGSGSYTSDIRLSVYNAAGDVLVYDGDSGYETPFEFSSGATDSLIVIEVRKYGINDLDGNVGITVTKI